MISQTQNWLWVIDARGKVVRQGGMIDNPQYLKPGSYLMSATIWSFAAAATRVVVLR